MGLIDPDSNIISLFSPSFICIVDDWFKMGQRWLRQPFYNFGKNRVSLEGTLDKNELKPHPELKFPTKDRIQKKAYGRNTTHIVHKEEE